MSRLCKTLLLSVMLILIAVCSYAEALDLSALGEIEEAQMVVEGDTWTYPLPYHLLMTSDYIHLVNRDNLLDETYIPEDLLEVHNICHLPYALHVRD